MCSAYLYVLIALTEFQGESGVREEVGWVLVMIIVAIVGGNVIVLGAQTCKKGRARLERWKRERYRVEKGPKI